ncbi:MAG: 50S ribosome-binding GTPase [Chloroflexi bacterium]|nr:50S ribosome-binding GTPase [Chloroflexota bacterium]
MPANLPPLYFEAQKRFQRASTPWEKVQALEEMLAIMPHHKGTDKLRAELNSRISRLSEEIEKKYAAGKKGPDYYVRKEGAGQVALVGLPNVGKSQLVSSVTDASPEVGDYPFTTKTVTPGMMRFENVQIQLVDMPPLTDRAAQQWLHSVIRNADLLLIIVDLTQDPVSQVEATTEELKGLRIGLAGPDEAPAPGLYLKKAVIAGNKNDLDPVGDGYRLLRSRYGERFSVLAFSATHGETLDALRKAIFLALDVVRVYTKVPGQKAELTRPFVLKQGSTIADVAAAVHKDVLSRLKYAEVWGSGRFQGQRVARDHVLHDGDVVELHA